MSENIMEKPENLDFALTVEMFEDLNNALRGISKRTLMGSTYQYVDGRIMRVRYMEDSSCQIDLYK